MEQQQQQRILTIFISQIDRRNEIDIYTGGQFTIEEILKFLEIIKFNLLEKDNHRFETIDRKKPFL